VDSQTDSPSPFPEGREALFIQSGGAPGAFAAITMDPFFQRNRGQSINSDCSQKSCAGERVVG
jgi:hypothetical protein